MAGIIDSLKARRALGAAMLNPGGHSGSGSGLLIHSSSLQPQTVFRQTKASFSVKRPSMTLLNTSTMSSFSQKAEMKYSSGQSLLHLHPAPSSGGTASVQRAPMPLPVSAGSSVSQAAGENSSVNLSTPAGSAPAYPPKSERRPVVFDRSDGPSDFEKRLMAAKKQKSDQEAKQRGPDRRRVRTERVEISSGSSNEIQREILDTNNDSLFQRINRAVRQAAAGKQSEPEKKVKSETGDSQAGQVSASADTVRREYDESGPAIRAEADAGPVIGETVQREILPDTAGMENRSLPVSGKKVPAAEIQRQPLKAAEPVIITPGNNAEPAVQRSASVEMIQREPLKAAELIGKTPEMTEMPSVQEPASVETIQREPLKTAEPIEKTPEMTEKPSVQESASVEAIQREPLKTAESVGKTPEKAETPTIRESASVEMIQREPLKTAKPIENNQEKTETPAMSESSSSETIQREPLKTAKPIENNPDKPAVQEPSSSETVQREPLKTAKPIREASGKTENPAVSESSPAETIQREPLKTAKPVREASGKTENPAVSESSPAETIQREPLKTAGPVVKTPDMPAVTESSPAETVQREPLKTAEPVVKTPDMPAVTESSPAETVQRESLKTAKPMEKASGKTESPAAAESSPAETIQREPLKTAKPMDNNSGKASIPEVRKSAFADSIQRESLKTAMPIGKASSDNEAASVTEPSLAETVQREPVKAAEPAVQTHSHSDMPLPGIAEKINTVQRQAAPAKAVSAIPEKQNAPAVPVRRETDQIQKAVREKAPAAPTVERESDEDLQSMLSRLPKHYEMPKEQIEAIRSGKPYTGNKGLSSSGQEAEVRREFSDSADRFGSKAGAAKQVPGSQAAEAIARDIVQREPEFVLPKKSGSSDRAHDNAGQVVQREIDGNIVQPEKTVPGTVKMPGIGNMPNAFFGQNSFKGNSSGPSDNYSRSDGNDGLVQREPMTGSEPDTIQRELLDAAGPENDRTAQENIDEARTPVTAKQLDRLADKLVPRIKRIMRAEMERSVFR